jgi:hypothetical protein
LNISLLGTPSSSAACYAVKQYPEANSTVKEGSVISVEFRITELDDHTLLQD